MHSRCCRSSLSLVVDQFQALTDYASVVNRLAVFEEACESAGKRSAAWRRQIEVVEEGAQVVTGRRHADDARLVARRCSSMSRLLEVPEAIALLLTGPTGAGKTSLMRAVAGLWSFGSGRILRPPPRRSCSCRKSRT